VFDKIWATKSSKIGSNIFPNYYHSRGTCIVCNKLSQGQKKDAREEGGGKRERKREEKREEKREKREEKREEKEGRGRDTLVRVR
jgi:hypothetical protein